MDMLRGECVVCQDVSSRLAYAVDSPNFCRACPATHTTHTTCFFRPHLHRYIAELAAGSKVLTPILTEAQPNVTRGTDRGPIEFSSQMETNREGNSMHNISCAPEKMGAKMSTTFSNLERSGMLCCSRCDQKQWKECFGREEHWLVERSCQNHFLLFLLLRQERAGIEKAKDGDITLAPPGNLEPIPCRLG